MSYQSILIICILLLAVSCKNDDSPPVIDELEGTVNAKFLDFDLACNANLEVINNEEVSGFTGSTTSKFLHSDIDDFNQNGDYNFGDTLKIKFEVLAENPYPQSFRLCLIGAVPIKILEIE